MDFLKKAQSALGGSSSKPAAEGGQPAQKDDYVDKAFAGASKQFGYSGSKESNERITDAGREFYEKQTGKKVSDKISN